MFFQLWSAGSRAKGRKNASSRRSSQYSLTNKMKLIAEESGSLILKIHNRKRMENFKHEVTGVICISKSVYSWYNQQFSTSTQPGSTQDCCGQSVCIKKTWVCHLLSSMAAPKAVLTTVWASKTPQGSQDRSLRAAEG